MDIKQSLEAIYLDYYDGLYSEQQLKFMLLNLHKQSNLSNSEWSELILDAQWKFATDKDYDNKIKQLSKEN